MSDGYADRTVGHAVPAFGQPEHLLTGGQGAREPCNGIPVWALLFYEPSFDAARGAVGHLNNDIGQSRSRHFAFLR